MSTALPNGWVLKEVFTIEEVACALAGVSCKEADPAQVTRRERDLIRAIQHRVLPATYAYVDYDQTLIDWRSTTLTRQALLEWCKNRGISLAALATLATPAVPAHPATSQPRRPASPPNNRYKALLRVVAGLILLLADKSGPRHRKNSSESDLNKLQLQNGIRHALDRIGTPPESVGQNAFMAVLNDAFYEEIINIINTSEGSGGQNQPGHTHD